MTVVWYSRHRPTPRQMAALQETFGRNVRLLRDKHPFDDAEEIVARFRRIGADEMVLVAPLTVIRRLLDLGIRPILADMRRCQSTHPHAEVRLGNRHYRFAGFARVMEVRVITAPLEPETDTKTEQGERKK